MAHVENPNVVLAFMGPGAAKRAELEAIARARGLLGTRGFFHDFVLQSELLRYTADYRGCMAHHAYGAHAHLREQRPVLLALGRLCARHGLRQRRSRAVDPRRRALQRARLPPAGASCQVRRATQNAAQNPAQCLTLRCHPFSAYHVRVACV